MTAATLARRTIVVTRPPDRSDRLSTELRRRGARVVVAPAIEIKRIRSAALTRALQGLSEGRFSWITLTSSATVDVLAERLTSPRALRADVAVIGEGTAEAFRRWAGHDPQLMPSTFTTAALARAFPRGSGRVLCARADIAPVGLETALSAKGWDAERVDAYRTVFPRTLPIEARDVLKAGGVDAVTFTSASTVRGFIGALGSVKGTPKVVCIGPVTAKQARAQGLVVAAVATPHTVDGLVAALERVLHRRVDSTA